MDHVRPVTAETSRLHELDRPIAEDELVRLVEITAGAIDAATSGTARDLRAAAA